MRNYIIIFCIVMTVFASCKKDGRKLADGGAENTSGIALDADAADETGKEIFDMFICVDGPLRIRKGPGLAYEAVGKLETGERAAVTGKSDLQDDIDGQTDYWYQIDFNDIEGYVFGGYGMVIPGRIVIKSIDDFAVKLPAEKINHNPDNRLLVYAGSNWGGQKNVKLVYGLKLLDKDQYYRLYVEYRPKPSVEIEYLKNKYHLRLSDSNPNFGRGDEYKIHTEPEWAKDRRQVENKYEPEGTFFVDQWGSEMSRDIMSVLFEKDINSDFDAVLITLLDGYKGAMSDDLHAGMIVSNRDRLIPELIIYQLLYEYFCNVQIDIDDAPANPKFGDNILEKEAAENPVGDT
ncbi:MAG: SH3 domain-containing protein [Spirochaetaceae bacterium]|nr:SH3 domain-containing protein [Spirochaetaceae bacterium]